MENLSLTVKEIGYHGYWDLRNQIDEFVKENFWLLYEGACRMEVNIESDYYAPERIQINQTRLHLREGLKYADGHKYSSHRHPNESQIINTIKDIQSLLDAAAENIPAPFTLQIIKNS